MNDMQQVERLIEQASERVAQNAAGASEKDFLLVCTGYLATLIRQKYNGKNPRRETIIRFGLPTGLISLGVAFIEVLKSM